MGKYKIQRIDYSRKSSPSDKWLLPTSIHISENVFKTPEEAQNEINRLRKLERPHSCPPSDFLIITVY